MADRQRLIAHQQLAEIVGRLVSTRVAPHGDGWDSVGHEIQGVRGQKQKRPPGGVQTGAAEVHDIPL
jgi:hypothetical protein